MSITIVSNKIYVTIALVGPQGPVDDTTVQTVTGLNTDNTDPRNPIVGISVDGETITGAGTPEDPLAAVSGAVTSVFNRTGAVIAQAGDYSTALVTESTNLYFTTARVLATALSGFSASAGTVTSSDTVLSAFNKIVGNINGLVTGVSSVYGRTGVVTAQSGDYTTTLVTEGTNLYFTDARARNAITGAASSITSVDLTASRALMSDGSGKVAVSAATSTELSYLSGVTSAIQTQLDAKVPITRTVNGYALSANISLNNSDVGLGNVSNVTQLPLSYLDTDPTMAANSNTKVPSQAAVVAYVGSQIAAANALIYKGDIDCSANPNYPAANVGYLYICSVAGKIGGASGVTVEVGDFIICKVNGSPAGNQATVGANWNVIQTNLTGAVIGPNSSTSGNIATFSGTSGQVIQDSGYSFSNFVSSALASALIIVGSSGNLAAAVSMSGDTTISNTGVVTIASGAVDNAKIAAGVDAAKIGGGAVSNAEFSYLDGVSSAIQTQLDGKIDKNLTGAITSSGSTTSLGTFTSLQLLTALSDETGTGAAVFNTSPTFITPLLGTPTSGNLSNCSAYAVANLSGLGSGVATFLATPSSANLLAAVTDETGTGALVFGTSPTINGLTLNAANTISANGAASTPALRFTGLPYTAGTTTTNFPLELFQSVTASAVTSWSAGGTYIGVNANSGYTGNFIDLHLNGGTSLFNVDNAGNITIAGGVFATSGPGTFGGTVTAGATFSANAASKLIGNTNGTWIMQNNGGTGFTSLQLGPNIAAPTSVAIQAGSVTAGTANTASGNVTYQVGQSTGSAGSGSHIFQVTAAGGAGSALNAYVTALTIDSTRLATFAGNISFSSATGAVIGTSGANLILQHPTTATGIQIYNGVQVVSLACTATATLQLGGYNSASPANQKLSTINVITGTSNTAGANLTIAGSQSTGSGLSGDIIFQTGGTGAASTAQNSLVTAFTIKGATQDVIFAAALSAVAATFTGNVTISAVNIVTDTTTGTKIGTATNQKLGFYNSTPIVQPSGDIATALASLGLMATSATLAASSLTSGTLPAGVGIAGTPYSAGTFTSGTYTPVYSNGNFQYATNNGAHTLAPPAAVCTIVIEYVNGASAGTITTSGFTKVTGDSLTTTNGSKFFLYITKHQTYSSLNVQALQ